MVKITPVVKYLLIINIALFFLQTFTIQYYNYNLGQLLGLNFGTKDFYFFQFFTYQFMHDSAGIGHILFNMLALWMFGSLIENVMGAKRFLFYYLVCGIGAAIIQILAKYIESDFIIPQIHLIGASGSIYGVLLAFGYLFPNMIVNVFFVLPAKAKYVTIGLVALELYFAIQSNPHDVVAHVAHLGGMLVGYILLKQWKYRALY